jgi:hypothetical protein
MDEATELLKQLIAKSKTSKINPENILDAETAPVVPK